MRRATARISSVLLLAFMGCADGAVDAGTPRAIGTALTSALACGNAIREDGEQCDDGNVDDGDGCSSVCILERGVGQADVGASTTCGNNRKQSAEQCDDGNIESGDGCSDTCEVESGFLCFLSCEEGDLPRCWSICLAAGCGDGVLRDAEGESCDDGNASAGDGCSASCSIEPGATCTEQQVFYVTSTSQENFGVRSVCSGTGAACGNGVEEIGEVCDDGGDNGLPGYCSVDCLAHRGTW